jgi:hypothetical protein
MVKTKDTTVKPYKGCAKCRQYRHEPKRLRMHVWRTHTGPIRTTHQVNKARQGANTLLEGPVTRDNGQTVQKRKYHKKRAYIRRKPASAPVPDLDCQFCPRCGANIVAVTLALRAAKEEQ